MDVQRCDIYCHKDCDCNEYCSDDLSTCVSKQRENDNSDEQMDFYKTETALVIWAKIIACENNVPIKILSLLAFVNKELNEIVQWRLNLFKKTYLKYQNKFGQKLYRRLIGHPFEYDGTKSKIIQVSDMTFGPAGLGVFNLSAPLFDPDFTDKNKIAFTNMCLMANSPEEFELTVCVTPELPIIKKIISSVDYVDLGEVTPNIRANLIKKYGENEIDHPGRYFLDLNLATKNNPIVLGDEFVSEKRIYFKFTGLLSGLHWSAPYIVQTFPYFIAQFKTTPCDKYIWTDYGLSFNGKINTHVATTSLIRPRSEIIVEPEPKLWVPLQFWFNQQRDNIIPSHVLEYLEPNQIQNYSEYNDEANYGSDYNSEYDSDYEISYSDLD
ncbi:Putative minor capsid protein [Pacmanvirus A23]|uniref:Putative minor capsid protein n=1 Tax=Pacmanvirus A23 TaxID=1932881 RepID=UPI000A092087|nr:Putative minor capsid protein [Pacmanvirus A23]SIP86054.1 Putative minor capsid protein [Pacmanvirus A23]